MDWRDFIRFQPLLAEVIRVRSKNKIAKLLVHDKATITRWMDRGEPNDDDDVAHLIRAALESEVDVSPFQTYQPIYDFSSHLRYEEKIKVQPPSLEWLMSVPPPPQTNVQFCGITVDCPLGIASSPLTGDDAWSRLMLDLQFGLSTFKTRRSGPKRSWDPPQVAFVVTPPDLSQYDPADPPEVEVTYYKESVRSGHPVKDLVNSIGVPSEQVDDWCASYSRVKTHPRGRFVGISILIEGSSRAELTKDLERMLSIARELHPPFVELNLSCPNLEKKTGDLFDRVEFLRTLCITAQNLLKPLGILLIIKLPWLSDQKLRVLIRKVGGIVGGFAFRNTVKVRPVIVDRDNCRQPAFAGREFGGLSGPCTAELTKRGLTRVISLRKELRHDFGIIAIGGVSTVSDVVELLDMGENIVVQSCTAAMFDPLLAWKVRFHLSRARSDIRRYEKDEGLLLQTPRDWIEAESFRELHLALNEIRRRQPGLGVPYESVKSLWNTWLQNRSTQPIGIARRTGTVKRQSDWLRDLSAIILSKQ